MIFELLKLSRVLQWKSEKKNNKATQAKINLFHKQMFEDSV